MDHRLWALLCQPSAGTRGGECVLFLQGLLIPRPGRCASGASVGLPCPSAGCGGGRGCGRLGSQPSMVPLLSPLVLDSVGDTRSLPGTG